MRKEWVGVLLALVFACVPWAGSIDGKRFPCQVDDDCAGDSFVCIAGICRDPRDLALPDAAAVDSGRDAGDVDRDAAADAGRDAAVADHDVGRDGGSDVHVTDHPAIDVATVDGAGEDAAAGDAAADAGSDSGIDAGCASDDACDTNQICFSGRCGQLVEAAPDPAVTLVEAPALVIDAADNITIAYFDATSRDARLADWKPAGNWSAIAIDTNEDVGREPQLSLAPDGTRWVVYFKQNDSSLRIAGRTTAGTMIGPVALTEAGSPLRNRAGFVVDGSGRQHLLVAGAGLFGGDRVPEPPGLLTPPFDLRLATGENSANWPALVLDQNSGIVFGSYVVGNRPALGFVDPALGFVSVSAMERTGQGCIDWGLGNDTYDSCPAERPVALAIDSAGGLHFCTHMLDHNLTYQVVYGYDNGRGFVGDVVYSSSQYDSYYDPGVRCALVIDDRDVAHLFFARTEGGRGLMHSRVTHPDGTLDHPEMLAISGDTGYWPQAVVDANGTLHLVYVRVTEPTSRSTSTTITSSSLVHARLQWVP